MVHRGCTRRHRAPGSDPADWFGLLLALSTLGHSLVEHERAALDRILKCCRCDIDSYDEARRVLSVEIETIEEGLQTELRRGLEAVW
jgi:hypothetical protein